MYRNTIDAIQCKSYVGRFFTPNYIILLLIKNAIIRYFNICILKSNIKFYIKLLK